MAGDSGDTGDKRGREMMTPKKTVDFYRDQNEQAARLILADVARYGGPDSLMGQWAALIVGRIEAPPADWEAGPLFAGKAA